MMAEETRQLLRKFSGERSEAAFRELVRRHSPLVYGTALRMLAGDRAAAQDVTQEVFTLLARKAGSLDGVVLGAWLYRQTCRRASNHVRTETRRKQRELVAADQMNPDASNDSAMIEGLGGEVDAALQSLPASDRDALVLRYFEGQDFRKLGATLGTTEEAARKRVARAVEKLATSLRKRGIAVGSAALGTTMTNLGAAPVPATLIDQVTAHALKAAALGGSPWSAKLLKPAAAGVLATSLVAGTTLALQDPLPAPQAAVQTVDRTPEAWTTLPISTSLEDLITEIKRTKAGPGHALTKLRLDALLDRIQNDQIPEFVALARERLTSAERAGCFEPLMIRWANVDPDAALTFVLDSGVGREVNAITQTHLFSRLFESWSDRDLSAARSWLSTHWEIPGLQEPAFDAPELRSHLARGLADRLVRDGQVDQAIDLIQSLPAEGSRNIALAGLAGNHPYASAWMNVGDDSLIKLHHAFLKWDGSIPGQTYAHQLWKNLYHYNPKRSRKLRDSLPPADRFEISLGLIGVTRAPSQRVATPGGGVRVSSTGVDGASEGEAAAWEAGRAAGLSDPEILAAIGQAMIRTAPRERALQWLGEQPNTGGFDATILGKIREINGAASSWSAWLNPEAMIDWALRLSDPTQGRSLSRAAFRRQLSHSPDAARKLAARADLPADLAAEFREMLDQAR
jgi:RNA polymerase sigma factor (sigma-70 family)